MAANRFSTRKHLESDNRRPVYRVCHPSIRRHYVFAYFVRIENVGNQVPTHLASLVIQIRSARIPRSKGSVVGEHRRSHRAVFTSIRVSASSSLERVLWKVITTSFAMMVPRSRLAFQGSS